MSQLFEVIFTQEKLFSFYGACERRGLIWLSGKLWTMDTWPRRKPESCSISWYQWYSTATREASSIGTEARKHRDNDMTIKLADFGFSGEFTDKKLSSFWDTICYSGSRSLSAPNLWPPHCWCVEPESSFVQIVVGLCHLWGTTLGN